MKCIWFHISSQVTLVQRYFLRRVVTAKIKNTSFYTSFKDFELLKDTKIVSLYLKRISVRPVFREQAAKNHGPEAFALYPEVLEEVSSINR